GSRRPRASGGGQRSAAGARGRCRRRGAGRLPPHHRAARRAGAAAAAVSGPPGGAGRGAAVRGLVRPRLEGPSNQLDAVLAVPSADAAEVELLRTEMRGSLDVFERLLSGREYLAGDEFSAADCSAYPFLKYGLHGAG